MNDETARTAGRKILRASRRLNPIGHEEEQDYFSALNYDCICELFNWLSLDDLCEISGTSKKFKAIAEDHFERKYSKLIKLCISDRCGEIEIKATKYAQCFAQKIQNIHISSLEFRPELIQFIRMNCSKNIKKISFENYVRTKTFPDEVVEVLKNVETLNFCFQLKQRTNWDIVKLSPLVKNLGIEDVRSFPPDVVCPRLEVLECVISQRFNINTLEQFLRRNTAIKRLSCQLCFHDTSFKRSINKMKKLLKAVCVTNIEELFIDIEIRAIDFALLRDELQALNKLEHFKRFELEMDTCGSYVENLMELATLKSFTRLYLTNTRGYVRHSPALNSLVNLTSFAMRYTLNKKMVLSLAQNLPNLKEFCYHEWLTCNVDLSIKPFVRYSPNLTRIIVSCLDNLDLFSISMLNNERMKLNNATKLAIYVVSFHRFCGNAQKSDLVDISLVKASNERENHRHPAFSYTLYDY